MFIGAPPPPPAPLLPTLQVNGKPQSTTSMRGLLPPPPPPPSLPLPVIENINKPKRDFSKPLLTQASGGILRNDYESFDSPSNNSFVSLLKFSLNM